MSIFSKQVKDVSFEDIEELQKDNAEENIRLEYKGDYPSNDELVKKLSSFANTYGGYLIIGICEDGTGKIKSLSGVVAKPRYDQTVIQLCFDNVWPPITPVISDPIPHKSDQEKVFYVIYTDMSMEAPHFLTKRKGCYIRTDEYSQPFQPQLAKYEEIQHLANRRNKAEEKRKKLIETARSRFEIACYRHLYKECSPPDSVELERFRHELETRPQTFLSIYSIPAFPVTPLVDAAKLQDVYKTSDSLYYGTTHYQHDSILIKSSESEHLEVNCYGLIFYGLILKPDVGKELYGGRYLHIFWISREILKFLNYVKKFYKSVGFCGIVNLGISLYPLLNKALIINEMDTARSLYDNKVQLEEFQAPLHITSLKDIWRKIFFCTCFACGCAYTDSEKEIENYFKKTCGALSISPE